MIPPFLEQSPKLPVPPFLWEKFDPPFLRKFQKLKSPFIKGRFQPYKENERDKVKNVFC